MSDGKAVAKTLEQLRNYLRHHSNTKSGRITRVRSLDAGTLTVECSAGDRYISVHYERHRGAEHDSAWLSANRLPKEAHVYARIGNKTKRLEGKQALTELRRLIKKVWPNYQINYGPWTKPIVI